MKLSKRKAGAWVALAFCWMGFVGQAAHAQAVGVIDEDKLAEGFKAYKDAVAVLDEKAKALDGQLATRAFATPEEGKTFDKLILTEKRSAAEETSFKTLVAKLQKQSEDYQKLVPKATRTAEENTRLTGYQAVQKTNVPEVQRLGDELYNTIKKQQDEIDQRYTTQANEAVATVAKARNLSLVVRLKAVIWRNENVDVTEEVLKKLNG